MVDKDKLFSSVNLQYFSFSQLLQAKSVEDIEKMQPKEVEAFSVEELVLQIKANIITKVKALADGGEEDINSVTFEDIDGNATRVLNFSHDQVWRHGGAILQWLMHFKGNKLSPFKLHIPLSGRLIQDAAMDRELSRLDRNLPQAASVSKIETNATITEHVETLWDIMESVSSKHSEKSENF